MPHLTIVYTPNIEADFDGLCRGLCDTLVAMRDDEGKAVYPPGGTRVMAFPATHYAVADGSADYPFMYLNLRIFGGRPAAITKRTGDSLLAKTKVLLEKLIERGPIGITLQIDETPKEMPAPLVMSYEDRHNTLHTLFRK
jgi:5-carboxymethyl-2-hydroxymuconate isomerase